VDFSPQVTRVLGAALFGLVSCTGRIGDPLAQERGGATENPTMPPAARPATPALAPPGMPPPMEETERPETCPPATFQRARRISLGEYERLVMDLLGLPGGVASGFAPEPSVHGFDNQAAALSISSGNLEEFAAAAEIAAQTADVATLAPCEGDFTEEECAIAFTATLAARAYGRPIEDAELADLLSIYRQGAEEGYARGLRAVIETVLLSPYFLYRTEVGTTQSGALTARLDASEIANAVAFALTGDRPDGELAVRASSDKSFRSAIVLREESERLLQKPESRRHFARFLRGWLGVRDIRAVNKIPSMFPVFTPQLKADLDTELDLFLDHVLREKGGTLEALLGSEVTFASEQMLRTVYARDYGAHPPALPPPGEFARITFNPDLRKGVLSLPGWLAAHSPVHRSSPVDRGLSIRTRFFCQTLAPPPPGVIASAPGGGDGMLTTRQKFEKHTSEPTCRSCHRLMDPIGFGLEMMDALGAQRDTEAGLPVDSSGALEGTDVDGPFRGPAELAEKLLASRQVRDCFVVQMFRFVEGRDEQPADQCELAELKEFFATPGTTIGALATEMITHPRFLRRRVER
jgi:hypothetical protein